MTRSTESLVFLGGKRTPFGANGGALKDVSPTELCRSSGESALKQAQVDPQEIDHVIIGNVLLSAADSIYTPRHTGLRLGIPESVPALGINRLCGSGFQVIVEAFQQFATGDSKLALVGGVENMSMSPYLARNARWGNKMGNFQLSDMMLESLYDTYAELPMAMTAELLGDKYSITREQSDQFALRSQSKFTSAQSAGKFSDEIAPFELPAPKKGAAPVTMTQDEHPRADATLEKLSRLKPVFKKDGLVTAGNASGIVDGASCMVVATESEANRRKAKPLGRLVSYGVCGCDPKIMGIGPAPAIRAALKRASMTLGQMDLIEVNEAFAPQSLAVMKELEIPEDRFNVNGGAIAVGHPLAASGTRIVTTLLYELVRRKKRYGIGSACIGGGQGIALIVEAF